MQLSRFSRFSRFSRKLGATRALSGNAFRRTSLKGRASRLAKVENELSELKTVVEALAVRSLAMERMERSFEVAVLDADVAYRLLDNPPEADGNRPASTLS